MIYTVKSNDTLKLISAEFSIPTEKIIADNGIVGNTLVTGQNLFLGITEKAYIPQQNTSVSEISSEFNMKTKDIYRNNYILKGLNKVPIGTYIVLEYLETPYDEKIIGGYAYDFISTERLSSVINYLTYIMPFTYGFTPQGKLIFPNDNYILASAEKNNVSALMHISTLTGDGTFDSTLPSLIFENEMSKEVLLDNIISNVISKGYDGVDIDFEFLPAAQKNNYIEFTRLLADRLHSIGKILVITVPPKTSDGQKGLLVEGIDYEKLGNNADYILMMTYEYGYKFGPPLAISPINQVIRVIEYARARVPEEKLLLGISNYGYDWTLPYIRGISDAPSISTVEAVELAKKYGSYIRFDETAMAPFFFYTDEMGLKHEVWFEDARSFRAKTDLINEYSLAGGFIWDLMRDNPSGFVTINSQVKIALN